jgi:GNAT superfamily N-acetyltransferase
MDIAYSIRRADHRDLDTIVQFTLQEAREAEALHQGADDVRRGVAAGLHDPALATYWVAESANGEVVASTSVVREWSDFNGAYYWWIQSLFIAPQHRGRGLLEALIEHLSQTARSAGAIDLRLYAHASNERALRAYRRCGFNQAPYLVMQRSLAQD